MNTLDPIILITYILCLILFLAQIVNSFNDEFTIKIDDTMLKSQFEQHGLTESIAIAFKFDKQYEYNKIKQFGIEITNRLSNASIYVDWDRCIVTDWREAGTDAGLKARRMTRLNPSTTIDLAQEQVFSTIAPNTTLKETITAEDLLQRKGDRKDDKLPEASPLNLEIEVVKPLLDFKPEKPSDDVKRQLAEFKGCEIELEFFVEIALRFVGSDWGAQGNYTNVLCRLIIIHLPWQAGLPWNPRK